MLKTLTGAALLATALSTPALAATWDNFYVGGVGTVGVMSSDNNLNTAFFEGGQTNNLANWGGGLGVTLGKNWQDGSWVFGLEGDFSWTDFKNSSSIGPYNYCCDETEGFHQSTKWNWVATIRGRVGLDVDDTLVYATGGLAFVGVKNTAYETYTDSEGDYSDIEGFKESKVEVGVALGAGVERHFDDNWSFKAEFLYIGLPSGNDNTDRYADSEGGSGTCSNCGVSDTYRSSAEVFRVGINYALDQ
jgi:outer membrane immunogenic protein